MAFFSWVAGRESVLGAELTVRAQAQNPSDDGQLLWDIFFPRQDVPSVVINTITPLLGTRFVADRREWNGRGRFIPQEFPGTGQLEMIPIESYFNIGERELQSIVEMNVNISEGAAQFQSLVLPGIDVPKRTDGLVMANYRRIEVDAFAAWCTGQITAKNPVSGTTQTMSYGFGNTPIGTSRYQTAGTAWTGTPSTGTAYANFITWLLEAQRAGVSIGGAMMRLATKEAIRTSAPNIANPLSDVPPTTDALEQQISQEIGLGFKFYVNERTVDPFTANGIATTAGSNLWTAHKIAIVPAGERIGNMCFAPVVRAKTLQASVPEAAIDVRGMTVYPDASGNGRELTVECQVNALPVPDERNVYVIDAGI